MPSKAKGISSEGGEGSTQENKNVVRGICIDVKSGDGNDINEICKMITNEEVIKHAYKGGFACQRSDQFA